MAFKKTFSDIARSEFQTIYDGMLSTDKLYIRVGNNSSNTLDELFPTRFVSSQPMKVRFPSIATSKLTRLQSLIVATR